MASFYSQCLLLFILVIYLSIQEGRCLDFRQRACQRSDGAFCSVGKKHGYYIGLLDTAHQLRYALQVTSFRKEVIVFAETRVAEASQTLARLTGIGGYAHVLPVLDSVADCQQLATALAPWHETRGYISCGAYSSRNDRGEPHPHRLPYFARTLSGSPAHWAKWFTVARSVALGYNVMAVDSDVVVLDDWYWRVKQPPLAGYNMLSQAESDRTINGGFTYVQNAASNGPVAWLLYEAMFRMVRWAEDPSVIANASERVAKAGFLDVEDQVVLTDAMFSCVAGRPVFLALVGLYGHPGDGAASRSLGMASALELRQKVFEAVAPGWEQKAFQLNGSLAARVCDARLELGCQPRPDGTASTRIQTAVLRMPHSGGQWPLELGGYPFGRELGPRARAYRQAFRELGVPLPPDPEDPATQQAARATPTERFGLLNVGFEGTYMGSWAESTWWVTGRLGYWHQHLWPPPPAPAPAQAIGHVFAGLFPGAFQKTAVLQLSGHYDWRVAARLAGSPFRVFFTQSNDALPPLLGEAAGQERKVDAGGLTRVVAYSPRVIPHDLDKRSFVAAARGLAQVATSLGAVAAWPAAPCWAQWARAKQQPGEPPPPAAPSPPAHTIPWSYLDTRFTVQPFGDSLEELQCEWVGFADAGCLLPNDPSFGQGALYGGRGLLAVEFHHLRQLLGPKNASDPASSASSEHHHRHHHHHHTAAAQTAGAGRNLAAAAAGGGVGGGVGGGIRSRYRRRLRRLRLPPSPETTLRLGKDHEAGSAAAAGGGGGGGMPRTVSYEDLLQLNAEVLAEAGRREVVAVLWLDRLVGEVTGLAGEAARVYSTWSSRCRALSYFNGSGEARDW